jgi:hypothetical protein
MKSNSSLDDMSYFQYSFKSMLDKSIHTAVYSVLPVSLQEEVVV